MEFCATNVINLIYLMVYIKNNKVYSALYILVKLQISNSLRSIIIYALEEIMKTMYLHKKSNRSNN